MKGTVSPGTEDPASVYLIPPKSLEFARWAAGIPGVRPHRDK